MSQVASQTSESTQANCLKRENTCGQARLVLGLLSDWLRRWHKFSGPIPERDEVIPQKILESLSAVNEKLPIKLGRNFRQQEIEPRQNHGKLAKGVCQKS